jgi:hypothetical protein
MLGLLNCRTIVFYILLIFSFVAFAADPQYHSKKVQVGGTIATHASLFASNSFGYSGTFCAQPLQPGGVVVVAVWRSTVAGCGPYGEYRRNAPGFGDMSVLYPSDRIKSDFRR